MDYITVGEAAELWQFPARLIQRYCAAGHIPGARKLRGVWAIPAGAERPLILRRSGASPSAKRPDLAAERAIAALHLMPLMNTPFHPGQCREVLDAMAEGPLREIAWAEYHYFSGQPEEAARESENFLTSPDLGARLSACLIYAYANLSIGKIQRARFALGELENTLADGDQPPQFRAASAFAAAAASVLLHLPLPEGLPATEDFLPLLPPGLRAFALYVQAHYLYLRGDYGRSAGIVEATLAMGAQRYPISAIYLHLVAVMDYMSLKNTDSARQHLLAAWAMARPDDLIEGLGEHHGLLGGMLEAVIKPNWPEDFKRSIDITSRFSAGWRRIHNPTTGHDVADGLTTTEFAASMLAARGWTNQEIAAHMHSSPNTVKRHISTALEKLGISRRQDLKRFMLQ